MSSPSDCCAPVCAVVQTVSIPGVDGLQGIPGTNGSDGTNAFSIVAAPGFTVPALGGSVTIPISNNAWMGIGQPFFVSTGGYYTLVSKVGLTSITATLYNSGANTPFVGAAVAAGATVSPSGNAGASLASIPALTDNTTGVASNTLAAGVGIQTLTIPLTSLVTGLSTAAIDLLTNYVLGYRFKLLKFDFVTTVAGTGAGASQVFNLEIGTTNVTNTLTVTLASTATIGAVTLGTPSPITAANVGTATDTLSIEMAAGGTVFTAGAGYFVIEVQNMDSADSDASLAAKINAIRSAFP